MPFELQPVLTGELLELRPLRPDDFDALYAVASDPLIWEQHPERERYQEPVFRGFFRGALESGGAFAITDRQTGAIIGSSRYFGYDAGRSEIEIGWTFLARKYWGGAYNAELKRLMLEHAFRFVERVVFLVGPANVRSQRAMEKIGGVRAGSRIDDTGRESVVFEIRASDFGRRVRPSDVTLRDVEAGDLPYLFEQQDDAGASEMAAVATRDWAAFQAHWAKLLSDESGVRRAVLLDGRVAGHVVIFDRDDRREIGYWIGREFWGRGLATLAVSRVLAETAERPLYAWVASHNTASLRVLEKCGFARISEEAGARGPVTKVTGIVFRID